MYTTKCNYYLENNKLETISNLFKDSEIRSAWDREKEEYYFSVVDVIGALTNSHKLRVSRRVSVNGMCGKN